MTTMHTRNAADVDTWLTAAKTFDDEGIPTRAVTHTRPATPSEPEWVDVVHGIHQTCTDTGRSVLSDGRSLVLDRDDTACEAGG